ncbi:MAG: hypothetical protein ACK58Z_09930 [Pseudanabaena sp.]
MLKDHIYSNSRSLLIKINNSDRPFISQQNKAIAPNQNKQTAIAIRI